MYPDMKGVRSENSNIRKVLLDILKKRAQPKKSNKTEYEIHQREDEEDRRLK
jgi:hypothetical protein